MSNQKQALPARRNLVINHVHPIKKEKPYFMSTIFLLTIEPSKRVFRAVLNETTPVVFEKRV